MSDGVAVIADELTASLFRLAGARVLVPEPEALERVFTTAQTGTALIMITAELADQLPPAVLEKALKAVQPLTVVIPDARERTAPPDLVTRTRRILGVEG